MAQKTGKSIMGPTLEGLGTREDFGGSRYRLPSASYSGGAGSTGPRFEPAVLSQSRSTLGNLTGARNPSAVGVRFSTPFKKGGKVKKMAKGGSTASKRADGCAVKGKTKGRFV